MKSIKKNFGGKLKDKLARGKFVCIELNPELERLPTHLRGRDIDEQLLRFSKDIVDATAKFAAAFKLNTAYFEKFGPLGVVVFEAVCQYIKHFHPRTILVGDANSSNGIEEEGVGSAWFLFERCGVDAVVVNPYLGKEARNPLPILNRKEKGAFVLFQTHHGMLLEVMRTVRLLTPNLPLIIQNDSMREDDLKKAVMLAEVGGGGFLVSSSDDILYASSDANFAKAAHAKAEELNEKIRAIVGWVEPRK